ncbi:UNVERIFIED_CONTAM: hypothetical protein PYX00_009931 [Menopon gallinae]|uniref:Histone H2B n=1 Tax=Menopon gallinae TaxID=328185 RepID=A0AAW2HD81_9NEOP
MPPKTSGKAAKKAGKAQKNISKSDKKKKRRRKESYAIYIYKVLKQPRRLVLLTTTRDRPLRVGRSRPLSGFCCPANWRSTPFLKGQRLSPSTPARSKGKSACFRCWNTGVIFGKIGPFQGHQISNTFIMYLLNSAWIQMNQLCSCHFNEMMRRF